MKGLAKGLANAATSTRREALCRHLLAADLYAHGLATGHHVELLVHDTDLDGVDLTLVYDHGVVPLQLKARWHKTGASRWGNIVRRIPFPATGTHLHQVLFHGGGEPPNEGLGGALLVQEIYLTKGGEPVVWYRLGQMLLVLVRKPKRFAALMKQADKCPAKLAWNLSDLTPPLTAGEVLRLLLGIPAQTELDDSVLPEPLLVSVGMPEDYPTFGEWTAAADEAVARARGYWKTTEETLLARFKAWRAETAM